MGRQAAAEGVVGLAKHVALRRRQGKSAQGAAPPTTPPPTDPPSHLHVWLAILLQRPHRGPDVRVAQLLRAARQRLGSCLAPGPLAAALGAVRLWLCFGHLGWPPAPLLAGGRLLLLLLLLLRLLLDGGGGRRQLLLCRHVLLHGQHLLLVLLGRQPRRHRRAVRRPGQGQPQRREQVYRRRACQHGGTPLLQLPGRLGSQRVGGRCAVFARGLLLIYRLGHRPLGADHLDSLHIGGGYARKRRGRVACSGPALTFICHLQATGAAQPAALASAWPAARQTGAACRSAAQPQPRSPGPQVVDPRPPRHALDVSTSSWRCGLASVSE